MNEPVTITICGTPSRDTLTALFDLAVSAGLGLALQPRAVAVAPLQLPAAAVSSVPTRKKTEARRVAPARAKSAPSTVKAVTQKPVAVGATPARAARTYETKDCAACAKPFMPSGPNSKACARCRAEFKANVQPNRGDDLEKVWDGAAGRNGRSISSH
jgi:cell division septation protein DedD